MKFVSFCFFALISSFILIPKSWAENEVLGHADSQKTDLEKSLVFAHSEKIHTGLVMSDSTWGFQNLEMKDVLKQNPNLFVRDLVGKGGGFSLSSMGRQGNRINISLDGQPLQNGLNDVNPLEGISLDDIQSIESNTTSEYGQGTGSSLNLKSKSPKQRTLEPKNTHHLSGDFGQWGALGGDYKFKHFSPLWNTQTHINAQKTQNNYPLKNSEDSLIDLKNADNSSYSVAQNLNYSFKNSELKTLISLQKIDRGWPGTVLQPLESVREKRQILQGSLFYNTEIFSWSYQYHKLQNILKWGSQDQFLKALPEGTSDSLSWNYQKNTLGLIYEDCWSFFSLKQNIRFSRESQTPEPGRFNSKFLSWNVERNTAILQDQVKAHWGYFILEVGHSLTALKDEASNKIDASYNKSGSSFAQEGKASGFFNFKNFHSWVTLQKGEWIPEISYLYGTQMGMIGVDSLKNEKNTLQEVGVRLESSHFEIQSKLWSNELKNAIWLEPSSIATRPRNIVGASTWGHDLFLQTHSDHFLLSYQNSFLSTKNLNAAAYLHNKEIPNSPRSSQLVRAQAFNKILRFEYSIKATSPFWRDPSNNQRIARFWDHSSSLIYTIHPQVTWSINAQNLLSQNTEEYYSALPQPPRSFYTKLNLNF